MKPVWGCKSHSVAMTRSIPVSSLNRFYRVKGE